MKFSNLFKSLLIASISFTSSLSFAETVKLASGMPAFPFMYQDKDGNITGFEYELIHKIAELEGFEVEIVPVKFPQVFDQLKRKEVDFIGWIFKTDERALEYNFTEPHHIEKLILLSTTEHGKIDNDFLEKDFTISTLAFSPLEVVLNQIQKEHPNIKTLPSDNFFQAFKSIFTRKSDLALITQTSTRYFMDNYPQYQYETHNIPAIYKQEMPVAFMLLKENTQLLNRLNSGMEKTKRDGTFQELQRKYKLL